MEEDMTQCQELLLSRYQKKIKDKRDEMTMLAVGMGAHSFEFEDEIIQFLNDHPEATIQELGEYAKPFFPELEITDDEED